MCNFLDPETIASLLPYNFMWTPFCPDLDQAILEPRYTRKSYGRFASIWLHLDTFLSRSESSHFRTQVHLPKTMPNVLPYGFIWTPFCPDLDKPFSNQGTPSQSYCRFASIWLHLHAFLSGSGSSHVRAQVRPLRAMLGTILVPLRTF